MMQLDVTYTTQICVCYLMSVTNYSYLRNSMKMVWFEVYVYL